MTDDKIKRYDVDQGEHYELEIGDYCLSVDVEKLESAMQSAQEEIDRLKCCGNCSFSNKRGYSVYHNIKCDMCTRNPEESERELDNWEAKK